jgi:hypothetical protein
MCGLRIASEFFPLCVINVSKFMSEQLLFGRLDAARREKHGIEINTARREYDKRSTLSWVVTDLKLGSLDVNFIYKLAGVVAKR